jgi:hypothetical protein
MTGVAVALASRGWYGLPFCNRAYRPAEAPPPSPPPGDCSSTLGPAVNKLSQMPRPSKQRREAWRAEPRAGMARARIQFTSRCPWTPVDPSDVRQLRRIAHHPPLTTLRSPPCLKRNKPKPHRMKVAPENTAGELRTLAWGVIAGVYNLLGKRGARSPASLAAAVPTRIEFEACQSQLFHEAQSKDMGWLCLVRRREW